jgi:hypothetical protein
MPVSTKLCVRLVLFLGVSVSVTPLLRPDPDSVRLKDLVVTATRVATPPQSVGSSATVLLAAELARHQIFALRDALQLVPGATMLVNGAPGAVASFFLRGVASTQTLFRVDGIRGNDANAMFRGDARGRRAGRHRPRRDRTGPKAPSMAARPWGASSRSKRRAGSGKLSGNAELGGGSFKSWRGKARPAGEHRAVRLFRVRDRQRDRQRAAGPTIGISAPRRRASTTTWPGGSGRGHLPRPAERLHQSGRPADQQQPLRRTNRPTTTTWPRLSWR